MRRLLFGAGALALLTGGFFLVQARFSRHVEIPTAQVRRGEFLISLTANGEVDAKRAYSIVAPRIRNIQITWMAPEGSTVKAGDTVIKFDATQQQAELAENESNLKINQTALERARQELAIQEKQLKLELQQAQRNYDEKRHDAPKVAEEARLQLELAELNAKAKLDQTRSDVQKAELEVQRAKDKVALASKELDQMTLTAPIPGMVVYLNIWKGNSEGKVQAGDSPWPGQGLINLPDLSEMIVKATVSEVDASRVQVGQEVIVSLDAFPEVKFKGVTNQKGTLARRKDQNSKINVFDVEIGIMDKDERLKPGMSATSQIVVERLANIVSVPMEAVFEVEGKPVVYLAGKKRRDIQVGRRTDMEIEVTAGLQGNERVCLVDPTQTRPGLPGEKATEPELNKGRTAAPAPVSTK
jgi:HlyD family secretion protein